MPASSACAKSNNGSRVMSHEPRYAYTCTYYAMHLFHSCMSVIFSMVRTESTSKAHSMQNACIEGRSTMCMRLLCMIRQEATACGDVYLEEALQEV